MDKPDTAWFKEKIRKSPYGSLRQLAKRIQIINGKAMEPMALHRLIYGKRMLQLNEARQMADLLHVPMVELIRRWGVSVGAHDIPADLKK